jgi:RNA polymerase sigma factor (sigma-70 family)
VYRISLPAASQQNRHGRHWFENQVSEVGMIDTQLVDEWFVQEVVPLEAALVRFLRRNWRNAADLLDLRQDVYVRVYEAAREGLPTHTKAFVFASARNLLIDRVRRARVIPIEAVADLETLNVLGDTVTPDRHLSARDELRRFQDGLDRLPSRCREVIVLRKIDGLSQREVAHRMGIGEATVERQTRHGLRALSDFMLGGAGKIRRSTPTTRARKIEQP